MRLNKKIQYGVLFCLYLARAGRATSEEASYNLGLSRTFLDQVARNLRIAGVIHSVRGPGGGYELEKDVTMLEVFSALSSVSFLNRDEFTNHSKGAPENRALAYYSQNLGLGIYPILKRKVSAVMNELVVNEMVHLNSLDVNGLEQ